MYQQELVKSHSVNGGMFGGGLNSGLITETDYTNGPFYFVSNKIVTHTIHNTNCKLFINYLNWSGNANSIASILYTTSFLRTTALKHLQDVYPRVAVHWP